MTTADDWIALTPGGPAAVALRRLWDGEGEIDLVVPSAQIAPAVTAIAFHVFRRTEAKIVLLASDRWAHDVKWSLAELLGRNRVVSHPVTAGMNRAIQVASNQGRKALIQVSLPRDQQTAAIELRCSLSHHGCNLGPMPLDIAIAGEQAAT